MANIGRFLDRIYLAGAWLSGALMVLLCLLVLWSIFARVVGTFAGGATDVAGYVMATSAFMALAHAFRAHAHIRVAIVVERLHGRTRRVAEVVCLGVTTAVTGFLALYMTRLTLDSHAFGERSEGADAILLWIPQTPVAAGSILFAVAVAHTFVEALAGAEPAPSEAGHP